MHTPPRGDPQRPMELAIRSTRLLGVASTAFGLVIVFAFGYELFQFAHLFLQAVPAGFGNIPFVFGNQLVPE